MVNALIDALPLMDSKRDIRNKRWLSTWGLIRKRGFLRFWMIYGLLYFILSFAVIFLLVYVFSEQVPQLKEFLGDIVLSNLLVAAILGLLLSLTRWIWNELKYTRLGAKYPTATQLY